MFTGLVKDVGRIETIERRDSGTDRMTIATDLATEAFEIGESIAVDGACLTVVETTEGTFSVDVSPETRSVTTLGNRTEGDALHLERALRVGDRLGGHFVTGHVDGMGEVTSVESAEDHRNITFRTPQAVARYLLPKGCIAVDGVSLTINAVDGARFEVTIVPHTERETKIGTYSAGDRVNLEADLLGKYVDKLQGDGADQQVGPEHLFDTSGPPAESHDEIE